jgi:hypothetical protein
VNYWCLLVQWFYVHMDMVENYSGELEVTFPHPAGVDLLLSRNVAYMFTHIYIQSAH